LQVQNEDLTHEKLQMFNRLWSINFSGDSLLVFSTGRSPNLFCQLWVSDAVYRIVNNYIFARMCIARLSICS
jgi:hypothetical protein